MVRYLALASVVMALAACSPEGDTSGEAPSTSTRGTSSAEDRSVVELVRLATPLPGFRQQCEDAAASLGFAVPCPKSLPLISGEPIDCDGDCLATAGGGETLDTIFFLNVQGYDSEAPSETDRHLIVEARRIERAPPSPCYESVPAGGLRTNGREVAVLDCPPSTPKAQREVMHGEGVHIEHLLGYWDEGRARYVVSVHGSTKPNRRLLRQLVSSIEIIEP
jgi:hypothetical protein